MNESDLAVRNPAARLKAVIAMVVLAANAVLALLAYPVIHRNPLLGLPVLLAAGLAAVWAANSYEEAAGR